MTLKKIIDKMFNQMIADDYDIYSNTDFYNIWDDIDNGIAKGGVQWFFEWRMDDNISEEREESIKKAIFNYIYLKVKPNYQGVV